MKHEQVFDSEVVEAVKQAVREQGEEAAVADRLLAWLRATARGESNLGRSTDVEEHYQAIASVMQTELPEEDV